MPENRLARETSPYLIQHKDNPVDWWPWSPSALEEAEKTGKPILLSVGYAACHWCHVMAHESFEDEATAKVMNELFVNIKVDREERPEIDEIYMNALHMMGEQGGWPLTMFLTSKGEPVWGGTYFPKESRYGKPAFVNILREVARIFREDSVRVDNNRKVLVERLAQRAQTDARVTLGPAQLDEVATRIAALFDPMHGGLKGAPKFPQCSILELLWRAGERSLSSSSPGRREAASPGDPRLQAKGVDGRVFRREDGASRLLPGHDGKANSFFEVVELTLERMCEGGIYDHLGGGFARYSVDERWLVPHFEKMLYDNAQLLELLALAYTRSGNALFRDRAVETVEWLAREMIVEGGGFASSLDADSEGEEGKFYVWSKAEIEAVLGKDDADYFASIYDVTADGNFEGHNILNRLETIDRNSCDDARLRKLREILLRARAKRVRPGLDDKVLADWNGLMIAALANAGAMLGEGAWIAMATRAFRFVAESMSQNGRLGHSYREGRLVFPGLSSDYAAMIRAALALHQATGEKEFLDRAVAWAALLEKHHTDSDTGVYFLTADDARALIVRLALTRDDALPNPNAVTAQNLIRLSLLAGDGKYRTRVDALLDGALPAAAESLFNHAALLNALDLRIRHKEVVVTGGKAEQFASAALQLSFLDRTLLRAKDAGALPANHPAQAKIGTAPKEGAAFVCMGENCSLPITEPGKLAQA